MYPRRSQRDESVALGLEHRHPLLSVQTGSRTNVEVDAVLGDLVLRHLLEEEPWAVPVRVLDGRSRVALLLGYAGPRQEVVPRGERVGTIELPTPLVRWRMMRTKVSLAG